LRKKGNAKNKKGPQWAFSDGAREEQINGRTVAARNAVSSAPGGRR
jgi:hypothetical protein